MKLTLEELKTVKDCLDITLPQLGDKSLLRKQIVKLLDKIEDLTDNICDECGGDIIDYEIEGRGNPPTTNAHPLMPKKLISYRAIWIKSVCQQCNKTSMKLK